jgi:hypothetical protein
LLEEYLFWIMWNERNKRIFQDKTITNLRALDTSIISLVKHWCNIKGSNYVSNLQIILPTNVDLLPMQIQELNQNQMHPRKGTCLEEDLN